MRMDAGRYAMLARRWWWLCLLGALFALAAYGVTLRMRGDSDGAPVYTSTATIFIGTSASEAIAPTDGEQRAVVAPEDLGRLAASYAQMASGRLVAERLAAVLQRGPEAESLRQRITARAVPGTQLIDVTSSAMTPDESPVLASGAANAFIALHDEKSLPGAAMLYEVSSPAEVATTDGGMSPVAMAVIIALVGVLSAAAVIVAAERFGGPLRSALATGFVNAPPAQAAVPAAQRRKRAAPNRAPAIEQTVLDTDAAR